MIKGLTFEMEKDIKKELKDELAFPGFRILWILYFDSNITMTDLTNITQANISNVFRQVTKLREEKLVTIECGNDARTRQVAITEKGKSIVAEFIHNHADQLRFVRVIDHLPKEDLAIFIKVCKNLSSELMDKRLYTFVNMSTEDILTSSQK